MEEDQETGNNESLTGGESAKMSYYYKSMLRQALTLSKYLLQNKSNKLGQLQPTSHEILAERKRIRMDLRKQAAENLPAEQGIRSYNDSIVNITLYMRQDCWKSQFIYLLLNYHQLGFRRVSDLVFLDRASYFLQLRKQPDAERWPSVKVVVALQPKIILRGVDPIFQFFQTNDYFWQLSDPDQTHLVSIQEFIDNSIIPSLQSLFWHPMLTYQYSFHTNQSSYTDAGKDNTIYNILGRNTMVILPRMLTNLVSIFRENQRYSNSKEALRDNLLELCRACLSKQEFLGGSKPGRVDFYLMAQLKTKTGSHLFMQYLQEEVGGQFWSWWMRINSLCQYIPERITTI